MPAPEFTITHGSTRLRAQRAGDLGVIVLGEAPLPSEPPHGAADHSPAAPPPDHPTPYLNPILADPAARESFFSWVDREGLIICKALDIDTAPYREVGGRYCAGRMSQSEYFHHDGCSAPTRPRIVEIRCPPQRVLRQMRTSVARFPQVVSAMLLTLPETLLRSAELLRWRDAVRAGEPVDADWEVVQGEVNRRIRRLAADDGIAWFQDVDAAAGSYLEPWTFGESRFMANENPVQTVQHRRAIGPPWQPGVPNGGLLKRWPAEELDAPRSRLTAPPPAGEACARAEAHAGAHGRRTRPRRDQYGNYPA